MTMLALDLGSKTGYAVVNGDSFVSGHVDFAPNKLRQFEGGGMRYLRFRRWLNELHAQTPITEIVYEEVRRHKAVAAAHAYGAFQSTLSSWCEDNGVPYSSVPVGDIKGFATGSRVAKKELMLAIAFSRWGVDTKSDDEADAVALLHYKLTDIFN